jgi:hypothetical protein
MKGPSKPSHPQGGQGDGKGRRKTRPTYAPGRKKGDEDHEMAVRQVDPAHGSQDHLKAHGPESIKPPHKETVEQHLGMRDNHRVGFPPPAPILKETDVATMECCKRTAGKRQIREMA